MDETPRPDPPWSVENYGFEPHASAPTPVRPRGRHRRTVRTVWPRVPRGRLHEERFSF